MTAAARPDLAADAVLRVEDLKTHFELGRRVAKSVDGVSFSVRRGETVAVVGESGSGKSVTSLSIMRLLAPPGRIAGGQILYRKRDGAVVDLAQLPETAMRAIRGREIAMIFQEPMTSLNPLFTVGDQIMEMILLHEPLSRREARARAKRMLELVEIPAAERRLAQYPHEMSGGMRQRVMIAMALLCKPKILIADEPTTALDVTVQAQMLDLFKNLTKDFGTALVMITHDLGVVAGLADKMMVMYGGRCVEKGPVDSLFYDPRHPYTLGLLHSTPHVAKRAERLDPIQGLPPSLEHLPRGCSFNPRCAFRMERCVAERPALTPIEGNREKACFYDGTLAYQESVA